eukprot:6044-Heterococcus_DN1.PRE.4
MAVTGAHSNAAVAPRQHASSVYISRHSVQHIEVPARSDATRLCSSVSCAASDLSLRLSSGTVSSLCAQQQKRVDTCKYCQQDRALRQCVKVLQVL